MVYRLLFLTLCCASISFAQWWENSLNPLPSPEMISLGSTGVAAFTDDAFSFYYNPAQLGAWSKTNNLSTQFYTYRANYDEDYSTRRTLDYTAAFAGYNFKGVTRSLDISIGAGYLTNKVFYGPGFLFKSNDYYAFRSDAVYNSYKAYSIGVGFHMAVDLSVGFTYKDYRLLLSDDDAVSKKLRNETPDRTTEFGMLLQIPLYKLLLADEFATPQQQFFPFFNFAIGASMLNGYRESSFEEFHFAEHKDEAHLGYSFNFGTDFKMGKVKLRLLEINWNTEAVSDKTTHGYPYSQRSFIDIGGIDIGKNLIERKASEGIASRHGFSIGLANILYFNSGSIDQYYFDLSKFSGLTLKAQGLFELLPLLSESKIIAFFADHVDIKYSTTTAFKGNRYFETTYSSIQLTLRNFQF